jgi:hypothetical protein
VRHEGNPANISNLVGKWFSYFISDRIEHCDFNARFCWATFLGDKDLVWVNRSSSIDTSFSSCTVDKWRDVRKEWLQSKETAMIVRFISTNEIDGHTVFSCKQGDNKVWTFQAYFNGCTLQVLEKDIFSETNVIEKIMSGKPITAANFSLNTNYPNAVTYNANCCMYLKQ